MNYSERMVRTLLARLPDGESSFEDFCDGDGIIEDGDTEDQPFTIRMTVKKVGDSLAVDFTGTDGAVSGPMGWRRQIPGAGAPSR